MAKCKANILLLSLMQKKITEQTGNTRQLLAKPFLKWAGGKSQLLAVFRELYPPELAAGKIKYYYEPFLGSGAVFFDIIQQYRLRHAYLYDINEDLVLAYTVVQQQVHALIERLYAYQSAYLKLNGEKRSAFFYAERTVFNQQRPTIDYARFSDKWIARAAQLIFLNRTCFNGLYRVNAKGDFNTPAGDYANPTVCDENNLLAVSSVLAAATIKKANYTQVKKDIKKNSFVYFDPPYRPLNKTSAFVAYSTHAFMDKEQTALRDLFAYLHQQKHWVMLSNSDPKNKNAADNFFDDLYKDFILQRVPAKRMINSNASKRGIIHEIVVKNY